MTLRRLLTALLSQLLAPVRWTLRWLLALVLLFEEWGWTPLARALGCLARLPVLRWLEARIRTLPPYAALAVFFAPTLLLLPIKLLALWLLSHGHAGWGLAVIVAAKLAGTAVVARLFILTQPQLMTLPWFARLYARWHAYKDRLLAMVRASAAWRAARAARRAVRVRMRVLMRLLARLWGPGPHKP